MTAADTTTRANVLILILWEGVALELAYQAKTNLLTVGLQNDPGTGWRTAAFSVVTGEDLRYVVAASSAVEEARNILFVGRTSYTLTPETLGQVQAWLKEMGIGADVAVGGES